MGGRGGSSGLKSGFSDRDIAKRLPDQKEFNIEKAAQLDGSEKQIKWANDIRKELLPSLANTAVYGQNNGELFANVKKGTDSMVKDIQEKLRVQEKYSDSRGFNPKIYETIVNESVNAYKELSQRIKRLNDIFGIKSAKFWIDHRRNGGKGIYELEQYIIGKRKSYD